MRRRPRWHGNAVNAGGQDSSESTQAGPGTAPHQSGPYSSWGMAAASQADTPLPSGLTEDRDAAAQNWALGSEGASAPPWAPGTETSPRSWTPAPVRCGCTWRLDPLGAPRRCAAREAYASRAHTPLCTKAASCGRASTGVPGSASARRVHNTPFGPWRGCGKFTEQARSMSIP